VVVGTGGRTAFGEVAASLAGRQFDTEFQVGLRRFSVLLMRIAGALTGSIFVVNLALGRPLLDALLFSLAIAVGITPQLLPAVVSTSLAAGSRQLRLRKVLVKRLVCVEDLGDVDLLFTDKTGTLTQGAAAFLRALPAPGVAPERLLLLGLLAASEGGPSTRDLDEALAASPPAGALAVERTRWRRLQALPFDHDRRLVSVLVDDGTDEPQLVTKGAPEAVLARCPTVPDALRGQLADALAAGERVIAVASRSRPATPVLTRTTSATWCRPACSCSPTRSSRVPATRWPGCARSVWG
jgi:Mg2+-importing ATPase